MKRNNVRTLTVRSDPLTILSTLPLALAILIGMIGAEHKVKARTIDGFLMYCTSNLDATGACINQEDQREFSCLIVPGQIISCPSTRAQAVECVWVSDVTANQAQFWCDRSKEAALYEGVNDDFGPADSINQLPTQLESRLS